MHSLNHIVLENWKKVSSQDLELRRSEVKEYVEDNNKPIKNGEVLDREKQILDEIDRDDYLTSPHLMNRDHDGWEDTWDF